VSRVPAATRLSARSRRAARPCIVRRLSLRLALGRGGERAA
jgi:hypothetical protein